MMKYSIRRSNRARRIFIKILPNGKVELVVPAHECVTKAEKFLKSKMHWIQATVQKSPINKISPGVIPLYGDERFLVQAEYSFQELFKIENNKILYSKQLNKEDLRIMLKAYLIAQLKYDLNVYADKFTKYLGVKFSKINIKETKGQWGSCSIRGNLSFSWRLIFSPKFVIEYLVAHEVSHLLVRNHSAKFWKVVGSIFPNYRQARVWLRKNGRVLHAIDV